MTLVIQKVVEPQNVEFFHSSVYSIINSLKQASAAADIFLENIETKIVVTVEPCAISNRHTERTQIIRQILSSMSYVH